MGTVKFILATLAFLIVYGLIDTLAGLIPFEVGILLLLAIIAGLIRLAFIIVKEANK